MILSSLCYIEKDGQVLLLHRTKKKNDLNRDKWIGIGGRFEDGESPEDCVTREVLEETGLRLTSMRFRGIVTFVSDRAETEYMHLFTADGFTGRPAECAEGDLAWVPKDRMKELPQWEGDRIFLRLLEEDAPFFSLKLCYRGEKLESASLNGKKLDPAPEKTGGKPFEP